MLQYFQPSFSRKVKILVIVSVMCYSFLRQGLRRRAGRGRGEAIREQFHPDRATDRLDKNMGAEYGIQTDSHTQTDTKKTKTKTTTDMTKRRERKGRVILPYSTQGSTIG